MSTRPGRVAELSTDPFIVLGAKLPLTGHVLHSPA